MITSKNLYLLRHGESIANVQGIFSSRALDVPLSDRGISQAKGWARKFSKAGLSAIYMSPLLRARQTAEIIGQECGIKPVIARELPEVDVGILEKKSKDDPQSQAIYERIITSWEKGEKAAAFPQGESLLEVENRLNHFLHHLESESPGRVLIVGHCLLFACFFWLFCENPSPTYKENSLSRGKLSIVEEITSRRFRIVRFNVDPEEKEEIYELP